MSSAHAASASAARKRAIQAPISSGRVFSAVRLTIRREVTSAMTLDLDQAVGLQRASRSAPDRRCSRAQAEAGRQLHRAVQLAPLRPARRARRNGGGRSRDIWWRPARGSSATDRRCRAVAARLGDRRSGSGRCRDRAARRSRDSRTPSARRCRQMPSCAAPNATKVATSNLRTRTTSSAGIVGGEAQPAASVVARRPARARCRRAPAAASTSVRMRPFGSARISVSRCATAHGASLHRPARHPRRRADGSGRHARRPGSPRSSRWHSDPVDLQPDASRRRRRSRIDRAGARLALEAHRQQRQDAVPRRCGREAALARPRSTSSKHDAAERPLVDRPAVLAVLARADPPSGSGWRPARSAARAGR